MLACLKCGNNRQVRFQAYIIHEWVDCSYIITKTIMMNVAIYKYGRMALLCCSFDGRLVVG